MLDVISYRRCLHFEIIKIISVQASGCTFCRNIFVEYKDAVCGSYVLSQPFWIDLMFEDCIS